MEQKVAPTPSEDGSVDEPVSSIEAVHQVLSVVRRKPTFLRNVGLRVAPKGRTPARTVQEAQLLTERARNEQLRATIEELQRDKSADKEATLQNQWDMEEMRTRQAEMDKKADETNAMLKQLLAHMAQMQQH